MKAAGLVSEEVMHPDRISHLPDDLLFRILSSVPVRIAMSTSFLSKRWNYVWKMMPKLVYDETCPYNGSLGFDQFCVMSLPLHEAPVVKTLNIKLGKYSDSIDTLLFPNIRSTLLEIIITLSSGYYSPIRFPNNLNIFKTLLVLKLQGYIVLDVVDSPVCFPSLKSLHLTCVRFKGEESFKRIVSACPVLEDLFLKKICGIGPFLFTISSPSLQRLLINTQYINYVDTYSNLEIRAHSLIYLKIYDLGGYYNLVEDMPKLVEADVTVDLSKNAKLLSSLERLSLRLHPFMIHDLTDSLIIFNRLLHLELDFFYGFCSDLIMCSLKHFPNLRSLKLVQTCLTARRDQLNCLVFVPKCLSFKLEILQWAGYGGTLYEREAAVNILNSAHHLKTATIRLRRTGMDNGEIMMKDLSSMFKASASCQLVIE